MYGLGRLLVGVMALSLASGCRTATRIVEEPRVDLDLSSGNRGYLIGTPPPVTAPQQTVRQMVETEIEVPSFGRSVPAGQSQPVGRLPGAPSVERSGSEAVSSEANQPETFETYVVQPGDTLWSIAARPNVYGDAGKWRRLFTANRDILKSPDQVRAGMTLRVSRRSGSTPAPAQETHGTTTSKK